MIVLQRQHCRGFAVAELLVAIVLLATAIGLTSTLVARMALARTAQQARQRAAAAAENVMEQVSSLAWDQLPAGRLELKDQSEVVAAVVPEGKLTIEITDLSLLPLSKRIDVTVLGALPSGSPAPPVRLSTWVYRPSTAVAGAIP